jgi:hypothetical protein
LYSLKTDCKNKQYLELVNYFGKVFLKEYKLWPNPLTFIP